jgi:CheY-like chemotaxis protein
MVGAAQPAHESDVVILDLGMPNVSGFEAARRIRALRPGKRPTLVALSRWGQEADRERTRAAGFDHHVTKPAVLVDLQQILSAETLT